MKRSIILLSAFVLVLISCKKDDPTPKTTSVLGTWFSTSATFGDCTEETDNGDITFSCPNGDCISYTFVADTIVIENGETEETSVEQLYSSSRSLNGATINESGTFTLKSGKIELCIDDEGEVSCKSLDLTLSGDELSLAGNNPETGCMEVVSLERQASE